MVLPKFCKWDRSLLLMATFLVLLSPQRAFSAGKITEAAEVFGEIMAVPEQEIPAALLKKVHAIAIVPGVIKVGFVIGGRHGKGVLMTRGDNGKFGDPLFISLSSGSVGWQIGAQSSDVILVFRSRRGVDGVTSGKFTLGADASVAAGPVGRDAGAGTDVKLKSEIYSYSRARGLFAGISLEGSALQVDEEANADYYGAGVGAQTILDRRGAKPDAAAARLRSLIDQNAGR